MIALAQAPTKTVINLPDALRAFTTTSIYWQPEMLAPFLQSVPEHTPLSVHGWGPSWLYAALIAHAGQQEFHQFDPKLPFGWIQPLQVTIGEGTSDEIAVEKRSYDDITVLSYCVSCWGALITSNPTRSPFLLCHRNTDSFLMDRFPNGYSPP